MKYRIVGILDILFSSLFLVSQLGLLFFTYPKLYQMYSELNVELPFITRNFYLLSTIFILIYASFFIVGIKLIKSQSQKLFIVGISALAIMLLFSGYFIAISVLGVVNPLYSLTKSL